MEETANGTIGATLANLREAYTKGQMTEETPEIAAIFEQIKHLRQAEQSLRSIRRTMELDNVPSLDAVPEEELVTPAPPASDLTKLLDSYLALRDEKDQLQTSFNQVLGLVADLQKTVAEQAKAIEQLQQR